MPACQVFTTPKAVEPLRREGLATFSSVFTLMFPILLPEGPCRFCQAFQGEGLPRRIQANGGGSSQKCPPKKKISSSKPAGLDSKSQVLDHVRGPPQSVSLVDLLWMDKLLHHLGGPGPCKYQQTMVSDSFKAVGFFLGFLAIWAFWAPGWISKEPTCLARALGKALLEPCKACF